MLVDALAEAHAKANPSQWIKIGPPTPLTPREKRLAKKRGSKVWSPWCEALRSCLSHSRPDRREFLCKWIGELDHADDVATGLHVTAIWLPVWR